ncbi:hypothetical protein KK083_11650 [Fulvivirgaceae bacterium PWU4]|uniref:Uncharacterized protein n=1 Tax=Chryseosolibacter histidini TaxID=2782349 RepID=A0AAP2DL48_9BACT|nr:hypothetical protein [Chryseosolibacter histidini]MBT1697534.1 hypothetical protein [Chryseosolibacter histidini]
MKPYLLLITQLGFIILTVIYFWLLLRELKQGAEVACRTSGVKKNIVTRILMMLMLWCVLVSAWSGSGMMANFGIFPFNFMPVIVIPLVTVILSLFSKDLGEVLKHIPVQNLIQLQSFRFFVELLLWALLIAGRLPGQMTFEGRNFDILTGITAPVVAWLAARQKLPRAALIAWNLICLGLLINIVSVAILSTPSPWRIFMNEPANTIVAYFPISWLPGFLVPLAYTLHFFSLRQLLTGTLVGQKP